MPVGVCKQMVMVMFRGFGGLKENPVGFLVVGSSPGEGVTSPSLGLSHAGRLFP